MRYGFVVVLNYLIMKMPEGWGEKPQPFIMRDSCKSRRDSFMARQKTSAVMKHKQKKGGAVVAQPWVK